MNTIKHVLLKGNENFLDHTKSVALHGKLYWRKSDKKLMLVTSCIFLCQVKGIIKSDTN